MLAILLSLSLIGQPAAPVVPEFGGDKPPLAPPTLDILFRAAASDLTFSVPPDRRPTTRYLSLHGVPTAERVSFVRAMTFAINSTSIRGNLYRPVVVANGLLLRIDLRGLGWDLASRSDEVDKLRTLGIDPKRLTSRLDGSYLDIFDGIASAEPYFAPDRIVGSGNVSGLEFYGTVAALAHSHHPVVAAHWLYPRLLTEFQDNGFYSALLLLPNTEADLYKRLGVNIPFADAEPRGKHGAAVIRSIVAYNPREIQYLPSATGFDQFWLWRTKDFIKADRDDKDVRSALADTAKHDGREILFSLFNGLMGGYLANGAGAQVNIVPQAIAEDQRASVRDIANGKTIPPIATRSVVNVFKCLDCHGESSGIIGFDDAVLRLIAPERGDTGFVVKNPDPKAAYREATRIEEFYRLGLIDKATLHRTGYEARVRDLTGLSVLDSTREVVEWYNRFAIAYATELVAPDQAAVEAGLPLPVARSLWKASGDSQLGILASGQPLTRIRWEQAVPRMFGTGHNKGH